ncbi:unnamed protein product [Rhizopus stolonifer]
MTESEIEEMREMLSRSLTVNPVAISYEFQEFIDFGKRPSKVTPFDLTVYEPEKQRQDKEYTIEELMARGTKLLDATLYQHVNNKKRFIFAQNLQTATVYSPSEIGEALFCVYYCLLTKESVPPPPSANEEKAPKFIRDIFKNSESFSVYSKMLASFDINLMDASWVKRIKLYGIPLKIKHRLSFGVLDHEILDVFRLFVPEKIEENVYKSTYHLVVREASKGPSWDIFPKTCDFEKKKVFEDWTIFFEYILHNIYTEAQVQQILDCGYLPNPKPIIAHVIKRAQTCETLDMYNDLIFPESILEGPPDIVLSSKSTYPLYFSGSLDEESIEGKITGPTKAYIYFES